MGRPPRKTAKPPLLHIHLGVEDQEILRAIAAFHGLLIPSGKYAGLGSISALMTAIAKQDKITIVKK